MTALPAAPSDPSAQAQATVRPTPAWRPTVKDGSAFAGVLDGLSTSHAAARAAGQTSPQAQTPGESRREGPPEEQSGLLTASVQPTLSSLFATPFPEAAAAAPDAGAGAEDAENPPAPATRELSAGSAAPPVATAVSARLVGMRSFILPAAAGAASATSGPDAAARGSWTGAVVAGAPLGALAVDAQAFPTPSPTDPATAQPAPGSIRSGELERGVLGGNRAPEA